MREILIEQFNQRVTAHGRYSLREFARLLAVSHSSLSLIIAGKRSGSTPLAERMEEVLDLSASQREMLRRWVQTKAEDRQHLTLPATKAEFVPTWIHYAVLNVVKLKDVDNSAAGIAKRLGLTAEEVDGVVSQLAEGGFIVRGADDSYTRTLAEFTISNPSPNDLAKAFNRGLLQRAASSLDLCTFAERDISSITFPVAAALVPKLKRRILRFRRSLSAFAEREAKADSVYVMAIQLFPLTTRGEP